MKVAQLTIDVGVCPRCCESDVRLIKVVETSDLRELGEACEECIEEEELK